MKGQRRRRRVWTSQSGTVGWRKAELAQRGRCCTVPRRWRTNSVFRAASDERGVEGLQREGVRRRAERLESLSWKIYPAEEA